MGSFQQVNIPSSGSDVFTAYQCEISEYKLSLERATEEESVLQARLGEMTTYAEQQFNHLENTANQEMASMVQRLTTLNSELLASQQEDEGATYRIEELERYMSMSNEAATHLEFQYAQLRTEFNEQMGHASAIMVHVGNDANASINQLRLELENAETTAKQEALAVNYANDRTCAIHVEMLELSNQNLEMKHTMSNNVRRLENALHYADTHRESIMRDFRNELRSENDRYEECEHHLAIEESQLQLQQVRNESLQMQLNTSESRSSDESIVKAGGMRDMRLMELRSELHMKQSLLDRMQQQLTESKNQYHELACQQARRSSPSRSPLHTELQLEMYQKTAQECERVKKEKADLFREHRNLQREVVDNEALIKTYQHNFDVLGKKYQDAVERLNFLSTHPKVTGDMFDDLHDAIQDRDDTMIPFRR